MLEESSVFERESLGEYVNLLGMSAGDIALEELPAPKSSRKPNISKKSTKCSAECRNKPRRQRVRYRTYVYENSTYALL